MLFPKLEAGSARAKWEKRPIHLILKCEKSFANKAHYVFSTLCKVIGLQIIRAEDHQVSYNHPVIWYGPPSELPEPKRGLISIHASPTAPGFYKGKRAIKSEQLSFASWGDKSIPFLFDPEVGNLDNLDMPGSMGVEMPYDIVASAYYFLSRWEETVISERDEHGRFPYRESVEAKLNLPENVVDIYLDLFLALLDGVHQGAPIEIPNWDGGAPFVACLTHDVDEIRMSLLKRLKFAWRHLFNPESGHREVPVHRRARLAAANLFSTEDPLWTFPALAKLEQERGFTATYNFLAEGRRGQRHYSLTDPHVQKFIADLRRFGFEIGLHGSYESGFDEEKFNQEKNLLAKLTGSEPIGHRQHYLRLEYALTLPIYERAGLQYDATLAYAEHEGYRNQFSYPYHPYNHSADRPFRFLELPTVIMDATLAGYRELSADEAWQIIETKLRQTLVRRGCITLLWHNPWEGESPGYFKLYPRMLNWIREHGGQGLSGRDVLQQWVG